MKAFDLEKALAGEPVVLRDGSKAFVKFEVPSEYQTYRHSEIMGFFIDKNNYAKRISWNREGKYNSTLNDDFNIVGMYEELRQTVTLTLPCPLLEPRKEMHWFDAYGVYKESMNGMSDEFLKSGRYFATEEDARAWFDAMKNARK